MDRSNSKQEIKQYFKKLISSIPYTIFHVYDSAIINSCNWIERVGSSYLKIKNLLPDLPLHIYVKEYTDRIKVYLSDHPEAYEEMAENWLACFDKASDDTKMFMTKMFYLAEIYNDDISKRILGYAAQTGNKDYRYWTTLDSSKFCFFLQRGYYDGYSEDRRELLKKIANEAIPCAAFPVKTVHREKNKLCIVTYLLDPDMHNSMQRVASMVANGLEQYFSEILVLSLESFAPAGRERRRLNTLFARRPSNLHSEEIKNLFGKKITVEFAEGESYAEKLQYCMNRILDFSPYSILDISDEYSSISYFYYQQYPTYYLSMRGGPKSTFFNSILVSKKKNFKEEMVQWVFPEYVPSIDAVITREEMNISADAFVVATIGNNDTVCDNDFVDAICTVLYDNPRITWMFVGNPAPTYLHRKHAKLLENRKVVEWGYEKNLAGLCKSCDVLLRANATGGSGATAIAAEQGLPLVMTNFKCDPMRWLGEDYSRLETYEELADEIVRLSNNRDYYESESKRAFDKVNSVLDQDSAWRELAEILKR